MLYQNALYAALQPTRKAAWSVATAQALLRHHGEKSTHLAAELALLFEVGRDHDGAAEHYHLAAENAVRNFAHREAVALARRGLALLEELPQTRERARRETNREPPVEWVFLILIAIIWAIGTPIVALIAFVRTSRLTEANALTTMLDPKIRLATSTPIVDPGGDYAFAVFKRAETVRAGATGCDPACTAWRA